MTPEKRTNEEIAEEVASVPFHDMRIKAIKEALDAKDFECNSERQKVIEECAKVADNAKAERGRN